MDLHFISQFGKSLNFIILSGNIRIPQSAISDFETSIPKRNMMISKNEKIWMVCKTPRFSRQTKKITVNQFFDVCSIKHHTVRVAKTTPLNSLAAYSWVLIMALLSSPPSGTTNQEDLKMANNAVNVTMRTARIVAARIFLCSQFFSAFSFLYHFYLHI